MLPFLTKKRTQCALFCPFGAFQSLFNKINLFEIRFNRDKCVNCTFCQTACPTLAHSAESIREGKTLLNCMKCGACVDSLQERRGRVAPEGNAGGGAARARTAAVPLQRLGHWPRCSAAAFWPTRSPPCCTGCRGSERRRHAQTHHCRPGLCRRRAHAPHCHLRAVCIYLERSRAPWPMPGCIDGFSAEAKWLGPSSAMAIRSRFTSQCGRGRCSGSNRLFRSCSSRLTLCQRA